jgi:hypothetical protein
MGFSSVECGGKNIRSLIISSLLASMIFLNRIEIEKNGRLDK